VDSGNSKCGLRTRGFDFSLIADAHTTETIDLKEGVKVEAENVIRELNMVMNWVRYPGCVKLAISIPSWILLRSMENSFTVLS